MAGIRRLVVGSITAVAAAALAGCAGGGTGAGAGTTVGCPAGFTDEIAASAFVGGGGPGTMRLATAEEVAALPPIGEVCAFYYEFMDDVFFATRTGPDELVSALVADGYTDSGITSPGVNLTSPEDAVRPVFVQIFATAEDTGFIPPEGTTALRESFGDDGAWGHIDLQ